MALNLFKQVGRYLFGIGKNPDLDMPVYNLDELPVPVPYYDGNGQIYAYVADDQTPPPGRTADNALVHRSEKQSSRTNPYRKPTAMTRRSSVHHGLPAPRTIPVPPSSSSTRRPPVPPPVHSAHGSNDDLHMEWDGWPDGDFSGIFSLEFVEEHQNLQAHWAYQVLGGKSGGSAEAESWPEGKITRRRCQGILKCTNRTCNIIVRPQTRTQGIRKQLETPCSCGGSLHHHTCTVTSVLHTFKHGVHYQNGGFHSHQRPTVRLHMSRSENVEFRKVVEQNPTAGPLKLLVGQPGVDGPGRSVADITPVLFNAGRIKYERRKILKGSRGEGGDNFIKAFAKFDKDHPNFIREAQFGKVSVIVMQTPFMASNLVKATINVEAVNGIVSDAAHRVWAEHNSLLIVSSTFEPEGLKCWVPGVMSYANGGTAEHYRIHFYHLFRSIAEECLSRDIKVTDDLFANVVDFRTAERNGFILAFIDFWLEHAPGERTVDELCAIAATLLKGCAQHFRNQITRVKKISGVVDPSKVDVFENYAKKLLSCENMEEFTHHATEFIRDFPRAESWIRWWMLPAHARMLFPSFRVMTEALWDSLPDTTNPEEAMHWKLYAALGRFLAMLQGLKALYKFAEHYQRLWDAYKHGIKIGYGRDRQHWKRTAEKFGFTKYSRHHAARLSGKRTKNDGRPPDTGKALLGGRKGGKGRQAKKHEPEFEKSYRWKDNSCWLDSSLTLLSAAASRDFHETLDPLFSEVPANHPLGDLRQMLWTRCETVSLPGYEKGGCRLLTQQRDGFRKMLLEYPHSSVKSLTATSTMFGWLYEITFMRKTPAHPRPSFGVERAVSYFRMASVVLRKCTGLDAEHFQLGRLRWRSECQLGTDLSRKYNGDLRHWFRDFIRISKPDPLAGCWKTIDGKRLCDGHAVAFEVILNLPVVFILELGDMGTSQWHIPRRLTPFPSNTAATAIGVRYNIVGHIYCNQEMLHFITRYLTPSGKKVFDYDGMKHEGHAVRNPAAAMRGTLTGPSESMTGIPEGYMLYAVMYHLEGGEKAQKFFLKEQISQAQKLGVHFKTDPLSKTGVPTERELRLPNLTQVPDGERPWIKGHQSTTDYIRNAPSGSPRKLRSNQLGAAATPDPPISVRSTPSLSGDAEIDQMLIDSINSPTNKARPPPPLSDLSPPGRVSKSGDMPDFHTDSDSPNSVWCEGCGMQDLDGDDDSGPIVQCNQCKYWAHIGCLPEADWDDPKVIFTCVRCRPNPLVDFFRPDENVMIPDPRIFDMHAENVLWYPAKFVCRHEKHKRTGKEYEFLWYECLDGTVFNSDDSASPVMMLRTFTRSRNFCKKIHDMQSSLSEVQIGKIRVPQYMDYNYEHHTNPELTAIFTKAIPVLAKILADFDTTHPVIADFNTFFAKKKAIDRSRKAGDWMAHLHLIPTPELEAVLSPIGVALLAHDDLSDIYEAERNQRVLGVGCALLQILAVQHEIQEPLNLNGDIVGDLMDGTVVHCPGDAAKAMQAMYTAAPDGTGDFGQRFSKFSTEHTIYDPTFRPPTYRRDDPSRSKSTAPIPISLKRERDVTTEDAPPAKRGRGVKSGTGRGRGNAKERRGRTAAAGATQGGAVNPTARKLRSKKAVDNVV